MICSSSSSSSLICWCMIYLEKIYPKENCIIETFQNIIKKKIINIIGISSIDKLKKLANMFKNNQD